MYKDECGCVRILVSGVILIVIVNNIREIYSKISYFTDLVILGVLVLLSSGLIAMRYGSTTIEKPEPKQKIVEIPIEFEKK